MKPQTSLYRQRNLQLRARTIKDLRKVWPALDPNRLDATYPDWVTLAAAIVGRDRAVSVSLAAEYLAAFPAVIQALPAGPMPVQQFATSMHATTVAAVKASMTAGRPLATAIDAAFVLSSGAATRAVLNAGRETVMRSAVASPESKGWRRVGIGSCEFCSMLLGRGAVYSEDTADFQSHPHCSCTAEPAF